MAFIIFATATISHICIFIQDSYNQQSSKILLCPAKYIKAEADIIEGADLKIYSASKKKKRRDRKDMRVRDI